MIFCKLGVYQISFRSLRIISMSYHNGYSKIVAVCQMTSTEDREKNLNCVESLVQAARRQNASVSTETYRVLTCKAGVCKLISNNVECKY